MAYNFQATFTEPLVARLDAGEFRDARDWANAITTLYINTIKTGLPGGVPISLPAPGLAVPPSPPPPFPIGVSGFITAESRKRQFYNVVYAYFLAKEFKLEKGAIETLINLVRSTVRRIKRTQQTIRKLDELSKQLIKELQELPRIIQEVYEGIKELVNRQLSDIDQIIESTKKAEFGGISDEEFKQVFGPELRLVQSFRELNFQNPQTVSQLTSFITNQTARLNRAFASTKRQDLIKRQLQRRLLKIATDILNLLEIPVSPSRFIDFANSLSRQSQKLQRMARAITRLDFIARFIKPKLDRVKKQIKERITYLREVLQKKLKAYSEQQKKKREERLERRRQSKREGVFRKASNWIKEAKKSTKAFLKKINKQIRKLAKVGKGMSGLAVKLGTFVLTIYNEVLGLKDELLRRRNQVSGLANQAAALNAAAQQPNALQVEKQSIANYFNGLGFPDLVQIGVRLISETLCTAKDIIFLFERRVAKYKQFGLELESLGKDFTLLNEDIKEVYSTQAGRDRRDEKREVRRARRGETKSWIAERVTSLKSLLQRVFLWLKPKVDKAIEWIKSQAKKAFNYLKRKTQAQLDKLEILALNLVPLSSKARVGLDKQDIIKAKRDKVRQTKQSIKRFANRLKQANKALIGGTQLSANLSTGKIGFADNESAINKLTDGIYAYKKFDKSAAQQKALDEEKTKFKSDFLTLLVIESIWKSIQVFGLQSLGTQYKREKQLFLDNLNSTISKLEPSQTQTYKLFENLFNQPPEKPTINDLKQFAEVGSRAVIDDVRVVNTFVAFERKYMQKAVQTILSIISNNSLRRKFEEIQTERLRGSRISSTGMLFYEAYSGLERIAKSISKQQSFMLALLKLLAKLLGKFFTWLKKNVDKWIKQAKKWVEAKIKKERDSSQRELAEREKRRLNPDAFIMSTVFGLAARAFWIGARWTGPTGSQHTVVNIGSFRPRIKARTEDGAIGFVTEMAVGFQNQLINMKGIVSPPPNTGITPIPFSGYT